GGREFVLAQEAPYGRSHPGIGIGGRGRRGSRGSPRGRRRRPRGCCGGHLRRATLVAAGRPGGDRGGRDGVGVGRRRRRRIRLGGIGRVGCCSRGRRGR